jgi:CRP/FNR family cyclic AMP-dependent transcriptional regulator
MASISDTPFLRQGAAGANCVPPGSTVLPDSRFSLFQWLTEAAREDFLTMAHSRNVPDGHLIYQQGDIGREMYYIVSGEVRLSFLHPDGRELVFLNFQPGDCFGFSSLIDGDPLRPARAEWQEPRSPRGVTLPTICSRGDEKDLPV